MEDKHKTEINTIKDEGKFTRELIVNHIEIYKKNGEAITRNNQLIKEHIELDRERWEKIEPMFENYKAIVNGSKMIRGLAYFILAVGTIVTVLYKLFK